MARPRSLIRGWILAAGLLPSAAPLAAQEVPAGYDQGLFEVSIPRVGSAVLVVLVNPAGEVLLPVPPVLSLASVPFVLDPARTMLRVAGAGGLDTVTLDMTVPEMRSGGQRVPLTPDEARLHDGEPYLSVHRLGQLLAADATTDWERLRVAVTRDPPFPAQRQADLEQHRRLAMLRAQSQGAALPDVPLEPLSGGGVLGWSFSSGSFNPLDGSFLYGQAGFALAGGRATAGLRASRTEEAGAAVDQLSGSYERVFPDASWIRRVSIGDVVSGGIVARSLRGVAVTNAPFTRTPQFDELLVQPELPPGWQFEVYQDGRLVGFSEPTGGGGPVAVPLTYGATPLEVRMYGPAGEEVTSELLYQIPANQLRGGRLEYSAGAGVCPADRCEALAYATTDYGLARWLTLGAGGELMRDSTGTTSRLSARGSIAPEGPWLGEFQALFGSYVQGAVRWAGNQRMNASVSAALRDPGYGQPTFLPGAGSRWDLNVSGRVYPYGLGLRLSGLREGGLDSWRLMLSRPIPRGFLQLSWDRALPDDPALEDLDVLSARTYTLLPRGWLNDGTVTAGLRASRRRLEGVEGGVSVPLGGGGQLGVTARWQLARGADLSIAFSRAIPWGRFHGVMTASSEEVVRGGYSFDGGMALDPEDAFDLTPAASFGIGFAGVRGHVFYDYDGDGRFSEGDEPATDIQVRAAGRPGRTDGSGIYRIWAVPPYDPVAVSLDTVASFLPTWVPDEPRRVLRPVPHVFNAVDFPLVRTRELIGELVATEGVATAGGVTLEIVHLATGEVREALTFSDGQFYVSRLRTGAWELRVSETSLQALGARAEPSRVGFRVEARGEDPFVELEPIRLVPLSKFQGGGA